MSSENSRKSFLFAIAAVVAGVIALPKLLVRSKSKDGTKSAPATSAFKLRKDPRTVSREDSNFA